MPTVCMRNEPRQMSEERIFAVYRSLRRRETTNLFRGVVHTTHVRRFTLTKRRTRSLRSDTFARSNIDFIGSLRRIPSFLAETFSARNE